MDDMILYEQTDNIFSDVEKIIEITQKTAFRAVDRILILRNWLLGKRIFEEELQGEDRAACRRRSSCGRRLKRRSNSSY